MWFGFFFVSLFVVGIRFTVWIYFVSFAFDRLPRALSVSKYGPNHQENASTVLELVSLFPTQGCPCRNSWIARLQTLSKPTNMTVLFLPPEEIRTLPIWRDWLTWNNADQNVQPENSVFGRVCVRSQILNFVISNSGWRSAERFSNHDLHWCHYVFP